MHQTIKKFGLFPVFVERKNGKKTTFFSGNLTKIWIIWEIMVMYHSCDTVWKKLFEAFMWHSKKRKWLQTCTIPVYSNKIFNRFTIWCLIFKYNSFFQSHWIFYTVYAKKIFARIIKKQVFFLFLFCFDCWIY